MSQTSKTKGILRWEQSMNKCREILDSLSPTNGCDSVLWMAAMLESAQEGLWGKCDEGNVFL
jgi:hypothetical protein